MAKKVTFTLDDATVRRIEDSASRLGKAKSEVVREAVADYHERIGKLSGAERRRMLDALDRFLARPAKRDSRPVDHELASIRAARRAGGRGGR